MLENSETRISPNKNLKIWFLHHVTQLHLIVKMSQLMLFRHIT